MYLTRLNKWKMFGALAFVSAFPIMTACGGSGSGSDPAGAPQVVQDQPVAAPPTAGEDSYGWTATDLAASVLQEYQAQKPEYGITNVACVHLQENHWNCIVTYGATDVNQNFDTYTSADSFITDPR